MGKRIKIKDGDFELDASFDEMVSQIHEHRSVEESTQASKQETNLAEVVNEANPILLGAIVLFFGLLVGGIFQPRHYPTAPTNNINIIRQ